MTNFEYRAYEMSVSHFIVLVQKIIALHNCCVDMSDAEKRFNTIIRLFRKSDIRTISEEDFLKYLRYVFITSPIKKYELVKFNGELLGI